MRGPQVPEYIRKLAVYVPGKPIEEVERELGVSDIVKLASNENPLGPSPKAVAAVKAALPTLHRYPDGSGYALRKALAARHGVDIEQVILGAGSVEIIEMLARAFMADGDEAVFSQQSFVSYQLAVNQVNGRAVTAPATSGRGHDLPALARAVGDRTKLIFLANPCNPTGTYFARSELDRFLVEVGDRALVVVDQAYHEYVTRPDYPDALEDVKAGGHVIVLRTFSKVYGLAGVRIGYGIASADVMATVNRVRSPFNTSSLAQVAALAALDDYDWVRGSREHNLKELEYLQGELRRRGVPFTPSVTNFVLVEFWANIGELFLAFQKRGVIIRPVGGPGLVNCGRVSVGTRAENARFLAALDELVPGRTGV
ncbi:MAG TPA: histidinol-phosphate transaminase [Thermoanaerobaculaceae bacterium]|nr:histidinol-phosphate transaminase [Thermoanaerobaculaceae bacterium]HQU34332.1 histidinol-phosphate transaminase [Thermoanaerobaculaceae bacterium]